jgi:hypothetical protein
MCADSAQRPQTFSDRNKIRSVSFAEGSLRTPRAGNEPRKGARTQAGPGAFMAKREEHDPLTNLTLRQQRYVDEIVNGKHKSKKDAALAAGYTESMAVKPGSKIETEDVREAFRQMMRKASPYEKCCQRIAEGQDAEIREPVIYRGKIVGWSTTPDYKERREYTKLAVEWGSYHIPEANINVSGTIQIDPGERLKQLFERGAARHQAALNEAGTTGSSEHSGLERDYKEGSEL